jgi:hypothetical protein
MLRLHYLYVLFKRKDLTYDMLDGVLWSSIELNTGILCACLPTLRPLLSLLFPKLLQNSTQATQLGTGPSPSPRRMVSLINLIPKEADISEAGLASSNVSSRSMKPEAEPWTNKAGDTTGPQDV